MVLLLYLAPILSAVGGVTGASGCVCNQRCFSDLSPATDEETSRAAVTYATGAALRAATTGESHRYANKGFRFRCTENSLFFLFAGKILR